MISKGSPLGVKTALQIPGTVGPRSTLRALEKRRLTQSSTEARERFVVGSLGYTKDAVLDFQISRFSPVSLLPLWEGKEGL